MHRFEKSDLKAVYAVEWKLRCPKCGTWAYIDDDQFYGRVSLQCATPGCDFHETHDLSELANLGEEKVRRWKHLNTQAP